MRHTQRWKTLHKNLIIIQIISPYIFHPEKKSGIQKDLSFQISLRDIYPIGPVYLARYISAHKRPRTKVFNFGIAKISATTEITEFREIRPKFRQNFLEINT